MELFIWTYQLWVGLQCHVLTNTQPCQWIPDKCCCLFMSACRSTASPFSTPHKNIPSLQHHDHILDFLDQGLPKFQLECLNVCRMYLQVTMLSEITNHTGEELLPQIFLLVAPTLPQKVLWILVPPSFSGHAFTYPLPHVGTSELRWSVPCTQVPPMEQDCSSPLVQLPTYDKTWFWHWCMHDSEHLVYQHLAASQTQVALQMQQWHTSMKFFPTVPTNLSFCGPLITLSDPSMGYIQLPIIPLKPTLTRTPTPLAFFKTLQQQFCMMLPDWQQVLFGSPWKAYKAHTLHDVLINNTPILIISDATIQKSGQKQFCLDDCARG